jgi:hypothetical protein
MGSTFIDTPGSVQRDLPLQQWRPHVSPVPPSQLDDHATRADIAELAYLLWEEQGCPIGSAQSDWLEAERTIKERIANLGPIQP